MQAKKLIILESNKKEIDKSAVCYLEREEIDSIYNESTSYAFITIDEKIDNNASKVTFKLILTDGEGREIEETFSSNCQMFDLKPNFNIESKIYAMLFREGELYLTGASDEETYQKIPNNAKVIFDNSNSTMTPRPQFSRSENEGIVTDFFNNMNFKVVNYKEEAKYYIDLVKQINKGNSKLESKQKTVNLPFYEEIKPCFEYLFKMGKTDEYLTKRIKNSVWKRIEANEKVYLLGKLYDEYGNLQVVGIGEPTLSKNSRPLGLSSHAKFISIDGLIGFGFYILFQSAVSGKSL